MSEPSNPDRSDDIATLTAAVANLQAALVTLIAQVQVQHDAIAAIGEELPVLARARIQGRIRQAAAARALEAARKGGPAGPTN